MVHNLSKVEQNGLYCRFHIICIREVAFAIMNHERSNILHQRLRESALHHGKYCTYSCEQNCF